MSLIPVNTPFYRDIDVISCGCPEPIIIPDFKSFEFALPLDDDDDDDTYEYMIRINQPIAGYDYAILVNENQGIADGMKIATFYLWSNKTISVWTPDGYQDLIPQPTCPVKIDLVKAIRTNDPSPYIEDVQEVDDLGLTLMFIDDESCSNNYLKIQYKLNCNSTIAFDYYLNGKLSRQPATLLDEETAVNQSGEEVRIYGKISKSLTLTTIPMSWYEHRFLENIINQSNKIKINGIDYSIFPGSIYTTTQARTAYMLGQVQLIESVQEFKNCCT